MLQSIWCAEFFSPVAKLNLTPLAKLTWMIKFGFPLPHPPSFYFVLLQFPPPPLCQVLPAVIPMQNTAWTQVLPESWMANPAAGAHPCLFSHLAASWWVMQPCTRKYELGSAWWTWGTSWTLPLPSTPGWLRLVQLDLHAVWTALGWPKGDVAFFWPLWGCLCLSCPWFPKGTHQTPEPRGSLEQSHESDWWKLPLLSPQQGNVF